ncbi:hypothetical protein F4782DRAFT_497677 [Xylaria castorea]|nr:hypothetical protein F4782DRAFT_497677 [Xylaria castorea]
MRHTTCLLTPARALHRVLLLELANTASKNNNISSSTVPPLSSALRKHASLPGSKHTRTQRTTAISPCFRGRPFSTTSRTAAVGHRMMVKHPRDKQIRYQWVRIAEGSGVLSAPQRTDAVLASLPPGHSLVMVAPPPSPPPPDAAGGRGGGGGGIPATTIQPSAAICRIIDAVAEAAAAKEAEKESKKVAQQTKTLELGWAIAPHDLAHKMKRLDDFLSKGMRVEMLLARKKGSRKATDGEGEELIKRVREVASDAGATEYKKADGYVGAVMKLFFECPKDNKKAKS